MQALSVVTSDHFVGAGAGVGWRPMGRMRLGAALNGGMDPAEGGALVRAEGSFTYLLSPWARTGVSAYAGGGVAVQAWRDRDAEYLLLFAGVESRPGGRNGWFLEAGVGGGVRVTVGVRWRPGRGG